MLQERGTEFYLLSDRFDQGPDAFLPCSVYTCASTIDLLSVCFYLQDLKFALFSYFYPGKPTHYDVLESMLRLAKKYLAHQLRADIVKHLTMIYPSKLAALEEHKDLRVLDHYSPQCPCDCYVAGARRSHHSSGSLLLRLNHSSCSVNRSSPRKRRRCSHSFR